MQKEKAIHLDGLSAVHDGLEWAGGKTRQCQIGLRAANSHLLEIADRADGAIEVLLGIVY